MASSRSTKRDNKQNMNITVLSQIENVIQEKENVAEIIDSDEDSDNKYQFHKLSKKQLNYKVLIFEEENKKLRLDNARLRTLRCVNEDLGKINQLSSNILKNLDRLQKKSLPLFIGMPDKYHDYHHCSNDNTNSSKSEMRKSSKKDTLSVPTTNVTKTAHPSPSTYTVTNDYTSDDHNNVQPEENDQTATLTQSDATDGQPDRQEDHHQDRENNDPITTKVEEAVFTKTDELNIGGRIIDKRKVVRIEKSKGVSYFVTTLMGIVFTKKEIGTCSMTGETSNFHKNKCDLAPIEKKQLDPAVRDALIEYVKYEFKVNEDNKAQLNKIKTAIKSKLNNEATKRKSQIMKQQKAATS
ncbi:uncharacterized protein [Temnothorax longispinosus]|uniref:uncharacterized protein n=1 Tax=Temnothorax longispinosus TaxID=300112 RepID=UPI003A9985CF